MENMKVLKQGIENTGRFNIVSKDIGVPLVAFSLKDSSKHTVFEIAENLRRFGWILPAYTMPADAQHVAVLRAVIREDFSHGLAKRLVAHIEQVLKEMDGLPSRLHHKKTERETQEEVFRYWKRLVDRKRAGVC